MTEVLISNPVLRTVLNRNEEIKITPATTTATATATTTTITTTTPNEPVTETDNQVVTSSHHLTVSNLIQLSIFCERKLNESEKANQSLTDYEIAALPLKTRQKSYWFQLSQSIFENEAQIQTAKDQLAALTTQIELASSSTSPHISSSPTPATTPTTNSTSASDTIITSIDQFSSHYRTVNKQIATSSIRYILRQTQDPAQAFCSLVKIINDADSLPECDLKHELLKIVVSDVDEKNTRFNQLSPITLRQLSNWLRDYLKHRQKDESRTVLQFFQMLHISNKELEQMSIISVLNKIADRAASDELAQLARVILNNAVSPVTTAAVSGQASNALAEDKPKIELPDAQLKDSPPPVAATEPSVSPELDNTNSTLSASVHDSGPSSLLKSIIKTSKSVTRKKVRFSDQLSICHIQTEYDSQPKVADDEPETSIEPEFAEICDSSKYDDFRPWRSPPTIDFSKVFDFCQDDICMTRGGHIQPLLAIPEPGGPLQTANLKFDIADTIDGASAIQVNVDSSIPDNEILTMLDDDHELNFHTKRRLVDAPEEQELKRAKHLRT